MKRLGTVSKQEEIKELLETSLAESDQIDSIVILTKYRDETKCSSYNSSIKNMFELKTKYDLDLINIVIDAKINEEIDEGVSITDYYYINHPVKAEVVDL